MSEHKPQQTLILFSIGPVQEFIAQARRTRDLWFGSHLLSELAKAGAEALREAGGDLIYPVLSDSRHAAENAQGAADSPILGAPNKILGIIETDNPRDTAWKVRRAITGKWREFADRALLEVEEFVNLGTWDRQIGDLIECYAAWTKLGSWQDKSYNHQTAYSRALAHVEELLAARKTLRDFIYNDPGRLFGEEKSSLDGGRESVWLDRVKHKERLTRLGVKTGEALDAVSVVKRLSLKAQNPAGALKQGAFRSVCETAFFPYEDRLKHDEAMQKSVNRYLNKTAEILGISGGASALMDREGGCDARLFYARRIEDYLEEHDKVWDFSKIESISKLQTKIVCELEKLYGLRKSEEPIDTVAQPSPYYAFLVADGDRMGRLLRKIDNADMHRKFSEALSEFSKQAAGILKQNGRRGTLVYGGGDDVMAYLPVHQCISAARELYEAFGEKMQGIADRLAAASGESAEKVTLSVGIAIVHMLEPLEEVRQLAQAAERQAKETRGALAVHVHKRGGGDLLRVALPFMTETNSPVKRMQYIHDWLKAEDFSAGFAYELRDLYRTYRNLQASSSWLQSEKELEDLLWSEIKRLARKKKPEHKSAKEAEGWANKLHEQFPLTPQPLEQLQRMAEQFILAIQLEEVGTVYEEASASLTP
ncbi:type III-B CRISPR-associated protein Cas10/Cmr2 [Saccharibacillus sp. CPCC 101409]|uniref:type III-B CRISPR-associated protein Cas10/Cmr2 n=1 Tax=Saccharibacillus sp. CPCC 101409 TaxID=3058041 RepID=UPI0026711F60|nr:type III-B CRISPR-associated protein Cas10/Cmr2 [Saccharibacillus sp. CPCC 101409]MDO3411201.1 type III-B CRISPR-associated protein Cas10/Cmr2 [Saccharibacillus sp. CPCC 101409]